METSASPTGSLGSRASWFNVWRNRQQVWFDTGLLFVGLLALCACLSLIDDRTLAGVSVWSKPIKFCLSLFVFFGTLAWFADMLKPAAGTVPNPDALDYFQTKPGKVLVWVPVVAAIFEIAYIVFQAAMGEASHFNTSSTFTAVMYSLMGFGAVLLVGCCLWLGCKILGRHGFHDPYVLAVGVGLILSFVLGGGIGGYLGNSSGHWVGGTPNDALGTPLFNWSMDGGDLRVSHFFGLHAMQALPLFALMLPQQWSRVVRWTLVVFFGCGYAAWTLATFVQAVNGQPLIAA